METISTIKRSFQVSNALHFHIEEDTRQQSSCKKWFSVRAQRVTGSICGKIVTQKKTISLLRQCLYPKPMPEPLPPALSWGRQNEAVVCRKSTEFMIRNGHTDLTTHPCSFIIHPTKGWLGASPDAQVNDPSCSLVSIAEFKCPFSKRDQSPQDACANTNFYGEIVDGQFHVKRNCAALVVCE